MTLKDRHSQFTALMELYFSHSKVSAVLCGLLGLAAAAGCSGGGGDGGGSGGIPKTGVRIIQAGLDVAPLELWTQGDQPEQLGIARFGKGSDYGSLGEGAAVLNVTRALSPGEVVAQVPVNVASHQRYSVIVSEKEVNGGPVITSSVVEDAGLLTLADQTAGVRVVHGLTGASGLVLKAGGQEAAAALGGASGYVTVPAGVVPVQVVDQATGRQVASLSLTLGNKQAQSVLVSGEQGYFVATSVLNDK